MATCKVEHFFRPGRDMGHSTKDPSRQNPGKLIIENKFQFILHKTNKDFSRLIYRCKYRQTKQWNCRANATVFRFVSDDGKVRDTLFSYTKEHSHPADTADIIAEGLKLKIAEKV